MTIPTSGPIVFAGDGEYHSGGNTTATVIEVVSEAVPITVKPRYILTGNVTPPLNASWAPVSGFELSIPAVVDDWVDLSANFMMQPNSASLFDFATVVGATPQKFFASGSGSPGFEGNPGMYPQTSFRPFNGMWGFKVEAGDLDGGNVRICLVHKGSATGTVFANTDYPFYWCVRNLGSVTVS